MMDPGKFGCVQRLFVGGLLWITVLGAGCPYKECSCYENVIYCNDRYLKAIPQNLLPSNMSMGSLDLDRNDISTIPAGRLPSNLSAISLQGNPIESIDAAAFDGSINTLGRLTFSQARFTELPKAIFRLKALQSLNINSTAITAWNDTGMRKFGSTMQTLNLDIVGFSTWPGWLQSYSRLTELSITGCNITTIPDDALDMVANTLQDLGLYNNSLTTIPKALSKLNVLRSLTLFQNKITDVAWLPQMGKLYMLSLHNNNIWNASELSSALRYHGDAMYDFEIHHNFLEVIPDLSFMSELYILDYTYNRITDHNSGAVSSVVYDLRLSDNMLWSIPRVLKNLTSMVNLVISNNRITNIQADNFPSTSVRVDLGYNLISEITNTSFPNNSIITYLFLNYNPINRISAGAFQNLPHLTYLSLQHSKLTRLPLAINSLTKLEYIDVTGSTDLVCTCTEKSLETRIRSMVPDQVVGQCGQTNLYIFFTELSPDCP